MSRVHLATAVALGLGLMAAPAFSQTADTGATGGQGDNAKTLQAVQVLGTRIKGSTLATDTPVISINAQDIQASGLSSIGDVLQQLSQSGSSLNAQLNSSGNFGSPADGSGVGAGATTMSLRNLNSKRTLVLVDGLRWVYGSSGSGVSAAVDLNTIPMSAIQRIEVLSDGASALYGSDAIAGVINIITKKTQDGASANVYYGVHDIDGNWSGQNLTGSLSFGGSGDRYRFFVTAGYLQQDQISSSDWYGSSGCIPGTGLANCSSFTLFGRFRFTAPGGNTYGGLCPNGICDIAPNSAKANGSLQNFPEDFHQFGTADRYMYGTDELLLLRSRRTGLMASFNYDLTPNIQMYFRGTYSNRFSKNRDAPTQWGLGPATCQETSVCYNTVIDVTNPYNPLGFTLDSSDPQFMTLRRINESWTRRFVQNVSTRYLAGGLNGSFDIGDHFYNWDVNFVRANNDATSRGYNNTNTLALMKGLGPLSVCQADPSCVPIDPFGGFGSITPEMLNYIMRSTVGTSHQGLTMETANLSGELFNLPAGPLAFAVGYEHRHLSGNYFPDPFTTAGVTAEPIPPTSGEYKVDAAYAELNVPLLSDLPGIQSFSVDLASRFAKYSTFGNTTNSRIGLRWQVYNDLTLRGTWGQGFRAPSIGELFGSKSFYNAVAIDPCNFDSPVMSPQVASNCAAMGVPNPATFHQTNIQLSTQTGANANLQPEESRNISVGAVYSPSWAANTSWSRSLNFNLTYYKISIKDVIQATNAQTLMNRCALTLDPTFCSLIQRNQIGNIEMVLDTLQNLGRVDTSGFDASVDWTGNETGFGHFGASFQATYIKSYVITDGLTGLHEPKTVGVETATSSIPRLKGQLRLNWTLDNLAVDWTVRYISRLTEDCAGAGNFPICTHPEAYGQFSNGYRGLGATTYNDVRATWKLPTSLPVTLAGGINNLFDRDPPACVSCSLNGYDGTTYSLPGRFLYVSADVKF